MCLGYKFRFASTSRLCGDMEKKAANLREAVNRIEELAKGMNKKFEELKKIKPDLMKLKVQAAKVNEYKPELHDMLHEKRENVLDINHSIAADVNSFLGAVDRAFADLKKITLDADSLLYKENNILNSFAKKIKESKGDEKLVYGLVNKINEVKENMKTLARKLFVLARAEEKDIFVKTEEKAAKNKIPLSEQISQLGVEIDEVGRVLEHLGIDDIDMLVQKSEDELSKLKKVELDAAVMSEQLEGYLIELKNRFYLLEDEIAKRLREKMISSEKSFDAIKNNITKNAEKLLEEIDIVQKISVKSG